MNKTNPKYEKLKDLNEESKSINREIEEAELAIRTERIGTIVSDSKNSIMLLKGLGDWPYAFRYTLVGQFPNGEWFIDRGQTMDSFKGAKSLPFAEFLGQFRTAADSIPVSGI